MTLPSRKSAAVLIVAVVYDVLTACALPQPVPPRMPPPRVRIPDVFIPIEPRSLVLTVGQTLVVRSDGLTAWSALADESVLPATPRAGVFAHQWRFRAQAPGTTVITFTSEVKTDGPNSPNCPPPPAPRRVVVDVEIVK